jgi:hypothetical protein
MAPKSKIKARQAGGKKTSSSSKAKKSTFWTEKAHLFKSDPKSVAGCRCSHHSQ